MSLGEMYAQHGSWRCWLSWDDPATPLLELVWQISGMAPRVLLQAERVVGCGAEERRIARQSQGPIEGPSGHVYRAGLSAGLSEIAEAVLREWSGAGQPDVRLLQVGIDIDTSEVILRRALDMLRHVIARVPESLDPENLHALLCERSDVWGSW